MGVTRNGRLERKRRESQRILRMALLLGPGGSSHLNGLESNTRVITPRNRLSYVLAVNIIDLSTPISKWKTLVRMFAVFINLRAQSPSGGSGISPLSQIVGRQARKRSYSELSDRDISKKWSRNPWRERTWVSSSSVGSAQGPKSNQQRSVS